MDSWDDTSSHKVTRISRTYNVYRGSSPSTQNRIEARCRELEDALDSERDMRLRFEKQCAEYSFQIEQLSDRLEESTGSSSVHADLIRKKDAEVNKLRKDIELLTIQYEGQEASMRKKHQEALNDLSDQVDYLSKNKNRVEKEKSQILIEIDNLQGINEALGKGKASADARVEALEASLARLKAQVDDLTRQLNDSNGAKARLTKENFDLQHANQELDSANAALAKARQQLQANLDDLKRQLDDESRQRQNLQVQLAALQADYDNLNARYEEESENASLYRQQYVKLQAEFTSVKTKLEKDLISKTEEYEELRRKLSVRIQELEDLLEQQRQRAANLEKAKNRLTVELREVTIELENTQIIVQDLTKRNRQLENDNAALQKQVADLTAENQALRAEKAALEQEVYRLKVANAELAEKNNNLERENGHLSGQLRDANNALKDANRRINDLTAANAALTAERDNLAAALRDTEDALKDAENKLANANAALQALRAEMEHRLREKDEEIEAVRKSGQRAIEELQRTLIEVETRYKSEISRLKKKYETDIRELEAALDNANRANAEYLKQIKSLQARNKELEAALEDTSRLLDDARSQLSVSERKRIALATELEDVRTLLESAERARKNAENELQDATVRVSELSIQITSITNDKRRMEADIAAMQADLDDALNGRTAAEERADRLQAEVNRLAEELRQEQDNYKNAESLRKQLEIEIREITIRLEEAEAFATREGKRMISKLQARIRDLEAEFEAEQRREREAQANARKFERQYKELLALMEDDKRHLAELTSINDSLSIKIKTYKRQIDEAEEVANIAMNKYRKACALIEEADARADFAEKGLQTVRRARSMSVSKEVRIIRN
ncbi:paramyosin-like isoform X2 [Dreissena polymorpha]|uniref:paramyosin-like isoform X2 n=1 Tax=Dreissena polymorpha TaxID=45954 RepID=UPI0022648825|nr:paramyosin-like isoform X2 [Dreissena polymorpha]